MEAVASFLAENPHVSVRLQTRDEPALSGSERAAAILAVFQSRPTEAVHRWGSFLSEAHLDLVQPLDPATAPLLQHLRRDLARRAAVVKNRRLQSLAKLQREGAYFSLDEMRRRCPLLFDEYVGQYLPDGPDSRSGGGCDRRAPQSWSEELLQMLDDGQVRARRQREEQARESSDAMDVDPPPGGGGGGAAAAKAAAPRARDPLLGSDEEEMVSSSDDDDDDDDNSVEPQSAAANGLIRGPLISGAERAELQQDFERLMHERFLTGLDAEFFDYNAVDHNPEFDDEQLQDRDMEDAYFDDDSGY